MSRPTGSAAGPCSTGLVDCVVALRGPVHRADLARAHHPPVRGRVLLVPAGFTLFWMTVFGDAAIHAILVEGMGSLAETVKATTVRWPCSPSWSTCPGEARTSVVAIVMVVVFFVTSADSGALVVDQLSSGGAESTPVWQRIFWSTLMGVVAIAPLLSDGLQALQTATIASAAVFDHSAAGLVGLFKALRLDATKRSLLHRTITRTQPVRGQNWETACATS